MTLTTNVKFITAKCRSYIETDKLALSVVYFSYHICLCYYNMFQQNVDVDVINKIK